MSGAATLNSGGASARSTNLRTAVHDLQKRRNFW